ncbi:hypothetical protein HYS28_01230 [Candidatus Uhrbacteria bacterium]|nr:hypothetical protein [Candidatus Uhrbacteria bacterium]
MRRIVGTPRTPRGIRTAIIFAAMVAAYLLLRSIPPVGVLLGYVEHGMVVAGTGVGNVIGRMFSSEESVSTALAACEERLGDATVREAALFEDAKSVAELEAIIGYMRESGTTGTAARITARSLPDAAMVTIDKGSADGIATGMAVVVADGHLFGVVSDVFYGSARVRLVHSRDSSIPATILGKTRTIGLVEGQEGSVLRMRYIPEDAAIAEGDIVVTSGLAAELPQGIVVGLVTSVISEDTAPFLEALIEPLYDARTWTNVLVVDIAE